MHATFYTVANSRYFIGLVGLVNSIRLTGHRGPIVVVDTGLTRAQRSRLSGQCQLVMQPNVPVANPTYLKMAGPRAQPADLTVIIDSDMLVTGSLDSVFEKARLGMVCAYADPEDRRWFPDWESLLGVSPLRHQTYVNAGFVVFATKSWPGLVDRWWDLCLQNAARPTIAEGAPDAPLSQADQDVLNALLMSEIPATAICVLPEEEHGGTPRIIRNEVEVTNLRTMACCRNTHQVPLLHWCSEAKPWDPRVKREMHNHAYAQLLVRATIWKDVPVQLSSSDLPYWLRGDVLSRARVSFWRSIAWAVRRVRQRSPWRNRRSRVRGQAT
jgi:hypothetical protein